MVKREVGKLQKSGGKRCVEKRSDLRVVEGT